MRLPDWDQRLRETLERHANTPYAAGKSDCFTCAMDCVEAVTGVRPYADVNYSTDAKGAAIMRKRGFSDLAEAVFAVLKERPRGSEMRGDIAALPVDTGMALGVVVGGGCIAWRSTEMKILPLSIAVRVFSVE